MAESPNPFDQQKKIEGIHNIICVASGKGGVGKSTVSANLAAALAKDLRVGLLDADIYGPSIPRMYGCLQQKPEIDDKNRIQPLNRHNVKLMSIGFLMDEESAVVWRGPMLFKAINQFLHDVDWGELDVLVIDLPPGTGDIPLSIAQKTPVQGAITVSSPQNVALADVKKSVSMFERLNVPNLGLVENMSYFLRGEEKIEMFPKGDLDKYLKEKGIEKLAEIPFHPPISAAGEMGIPAVIGQSNLESSKAFRDLAEKIKKRLL